MRFPKISLLVISLLVVGCSDFWGTIDDGPLPDPAADTLQPGVDTIPGADTVVDPDLGDLACPPGEWFYAGEWWCILCSEDGLTYANDGQAVDDAESCTEDLCDPDQGVIHLPLTGACWLEDLCQSDAVCVDNVCTGTPKDCDDDDPCTADSCAPETGECSHEPIDDPACDD